MIKNNKISEFLDQYSNELRRMGIYILIITFIFALSLKVIGDRTRIAPPEDRPAKGSYIEVGVPDTQIPENQTVIVDQPKADPAPIIDGEKEITEDITEALEEEVSEEVASEEEALEEISDEQEISVEASLERGAFNWPVTGDIINPYGLTYSKTFGDYRFNPGIDIKAAPGTKIKAALGGQVVEVETNQNEKTIITIEHEPGIFSRYSHLEENLVKRGEKVNTGQAIGKVGSPGLAKGAEDSLLHFQIKNGATNVDPTQYIK